MCFYKPQRASDSGVKSTGSRAAPLISETPYVGEECCFDELAVFCLTECQSQPAEAAWGPQCLPLSSSSSGAGRVFTAEGPGMGVGSHDG